MTRILLLINTDLAICSWYDHPHSPREIVLAINTGILRVGSDIFDIEMQQSACLLSGLEMVVVTCEPPEVILSPRLYQTLWSLADGQSTDELAREMGVSRRTIYSHYARLRACFGVYTNQEVLTLANELGLF